MIGIPFGAVQLGGTTETGDPLQLLVTELPERVPGFEHPVEKDLLERLHLERFRYDHLLRRGTAPFDAVRPGGDSPDFVVIRDGQEVRLDCAALAIQRRRRAYDGFGRLVGRLAEGAGDRREFPLHGLIR